MGMLNFILFPSSELLLQSKLLKETNFKGSYN